MIGKDSCYERMWNCHCGNGSHSSQEVELKKKKRWSADILLADTRLERRNKRGGQGLSERWGGRQRTADRGDVQIRVSEP